MPDIHRVKELIIAENSLRDERGKKAGQYKTAHGKLHACTLTIHVCNQGLSQNLETGGLKLAIVKYLGVQNFKGITIYSYFNHKHV